MIIAVHLVAKMELANLVFGYSVGLIFVLNLIRNLIKKTTWEESFNKQSNWFDYYSLIYLGVMVTKLANYQF